jgi:hypothetical protein
MLQFGTSMHSLSAWTPIVIVPPALGTPASTVVVDPAGAAVVELPLPAPVVLLPLLPVVLVDPDSPVQATTTIRSATRRTGSRLRPTFNISRASSIDPQESFLYVKRLWDIRQDIIGKGMPPSTRLVDSSGDPAFSELRFIEVGGGAWCIAHVEPSISNIRGLAEQLLKPRYALDHGGRGVAHSKVLMYAHHVGMVWNDRYMVSERNLSNCQPLGHPSQTGHVGLHVGDDPFLDVVTEGGS